MNAAMMLLALAGVVSPQSQTGTLPEIARQIRAERGSVEPTGRVFTNENIRSVGAVLSGSSATGIVSATTAAPAAAAEGGPTAGGRSEAEWREMFQEARASVTRAEERATLTEQELQSLNRRLLTETGLYNRERQLLPQITQKQGELDTARENVVAAGGALEELREELRRAGGPPGWGR